MEQAKYVVYIEEIGGMGKNDRVELDADSVWGAAQDRVTAFRNELREYDRKNTWFFMTVTGPSIHDRSEDIAGAFFIVPTDLEWTDDVPNQDEDAKKAGLVMAEDVYAFIPGFKQLSQD